MKRTGKTIECFNDIRKYLFEHKVPALTFIRDGKTEILYTQMYIDEKDKEIERLNNIINEIEAIVYADISNIDCRISIQEKLDKLKQLKENNND